MAEGLQGQVGPDGTLDAITHGARSACKPNGARVRIGNGLGQSHGGKQATGAVDSQFDDT
jgi:hypothetical protein